MSLVVKCFAWLWRFITWFWGVVVAGVIIGVIVAALTTGLSNAGVLLSWLVLGPLALAALLTLCAWLAQRQRQSPSPYVLKRVERLDPNSDFYVPRYVPSAYLPRPADAAARDALRRAARRTERSPSTEPLGVCIVGRPTQGKTRLAWEAMRAELTGWTLVRWGHNLPDFDYSAQRGSRLVLAIDDAQEYASNPAEVTTLNALPEKFKSAGARLVVVITCRDGDDEKNARETFGKLLERLDTVTLADITDAQADQLAALLKGAGEAVQRDQFDSTPGSLLLGVARMRDERYPKLPEPAKTLLRALKLLRSARIYDYPAGRVRATAADLFQLAESDWQSARDALLPHHAGFLRLGDLDEANERAIAPVADVYLEQAVPDYPAPGADLADFWPALERSLARRRDAAALFSLGNAFWERPLGNLRANRQHAEACYRAALAVYTRQSAPAAWAGTQNNLGLALRAQAGLAEGAERAGLLGQAVEAYRAALAVYTRQSAPADWAMTQNNLGVALRAQAELAEGAERAGLLGQAVEAYQAALAVYTRQSAPAAWAGTQNNLGNALSAQAELAEGAERADLLGQAVEAYQAALAVYTRQSAPAAWAGTQNNLGAALSDQASLAEGAERADLLGQAVEAYQAALAVYMRQSAPAAWAGTQNNLGAALSDQASQAEGAERADLLGQTVEAYQAALAVYTRQSAPADWAMTQYNLALLHLDRAAALQEAEQDAALHALQEALACITASLEVYTLEHMPADHRDAIRIRSIIEERIRSLTSEPGV
jgi:tetratricopeptide (TPR) repeat protein